LSALRRHSGAKNRDLYAAADLNAAACMRTMASQSAKSFLWHVAPGLVGLIAAQVFSLVGRVTELEQQSKRVQNDVRLLQLADKRCRSGQDEIFDLIAGESSDNTGGANGV
jgi:hypothetical protein